MLGAVDAEPELPGAMPDELANRYTTEEIARIAVRLTKRNICQRIEALYSSQQSEVRP
mgnify:CR=1 FL=1